MKSFPWLLTVLAVLLAAGALGFRKKSPGEVRASVEEPALLYLKPGKLAQTVSATGTVKPEVGADVRVGSRLSGVLAKLYVNIGDHVTAGQLLAQLEDSDWRARVNTAHADLASATAELAYSQDELGRMKRVPDVAGIQIQGAERTVLVREAEVERAQAQLAEAQLQLGYTRITAPVSGTIATVSTYEGETVAASFSAPTFVTIVNLDRLEVEAYVDEVDIGKIHPGQPAVFRVDAFPRQELHGTVHAIYPKPQLVNNVVNYVVIVRVDGAQNVSLRPEMTAHVSFVLRQRDNVLIAPRAALLREGGQTYVFERAGDHWVRRPIETGAQTTGEVEIVAGAAPGIAIAADAHRWREGAMEQGETHD